MSRAEFLASLGMTEDDVHAAATESRTGGSGKVSGWDMMNASAKMEANAMQATTSSSSSSESEAWAARYSAPAPPPRRTSIDLLSKRDREPEPVASPPEYGRRSPNLEPTRSPQKELNSTIGCSYGRRSLVEPTASCSRQEFNNTAPVPSTTSSSSSSSSSVPSGPPLYGGGSGPSVAFTNNSIPQTSTSGVPKKGRRSSEEPLTAQLSAEVESVSDDTPVSTLKELGNKAFQQKAFTPAIRLYSMAIEKNPADNILFSNRSAAFLQSAMLSGAVLSLRDAEKCIELQPKWFKGYSRAGDAYFKQQKYSKALDAYNQSLSLDPSNENTRRSVKQCTDELDAENARKEFKSQMLEREHDEHHEVRKHCADVAAAGRTFKEAELMKYRSRSDSRLSSRTDEESSYTTGYSSPLSTSAEENTFRGSQKAQAYRDQLMADFRSKNAAKQPPNSNEPYADYRGANYGAKDAFPKDTTKATDYVGKTISADSYDVHTYNQKHF